MSEPPRILTEPVSDKQAIEEFADNFRARLKRTEGPGLHPDCYTVEEVVNVLRNVARDHGIEVEK